MSFCFVLLNVPLILLGGYLVLLVLSDYMSELVLELRNISGSIIYLSHQLVIIFLPIIANYLIDYYWLLRFNILLYYFLDLNYPLNHFLYLDRTVNINGLVLYFSFHLLFAIFKFLYLAILFIELSL